MNGLASSGSGSGSFVVDMLCVCSCRGCSKSMTGGDEAGGVKV